VPFSGATVPGFRRFVPSVTGSGRCAHAHLLPAGRQSIPRRLFRIASRSSAPGPLTLNPWESAVSRHAGEKPATNAGTGRFSLGNVRMHKPRRRTTISISQTTLSLSRGKHNLRFGTEIFRNQFNEKTQLHGRTTHPPFLSRFSSRLPAGSANARGNGTSLSNVYAAIVNATVPDAGLRSTAAHFFVSTNWKITPTLTINLGFRLEVNGQQSEVHGRISNFYPEFYVPPPAVDLQSGDLRFVLPDNYSGPAPEGYRARIRRSSTARSAASRAASRVRLAALPSRDFAVREGMASIQSHQLLGPARSLFSVRRLASRAA